MNAEEMTALANDEGMQRRRKAVADPVRMRVLGLLSGPDGMTAKELAEVLRMNPNRLYYHLRILEDAGVIGVTDTRAVGRMVERVYKEIYTGRYIWDAQKPEELAMHLAAMTEIAKMGAEEALYEQARCVEAGTEPPVVLWAVPSFATTRADIREFEAALQSLQQEFRERAKQRDEALNTEQLRAMWVLYEEPVPTAG